MINDNHQDILKGRAFNVWTMALKKRSLTKKDKDLFLKGLQEHPEWVHLTNFYKQTALQEASMFGHTDIVKALIKEGADVNAQDVFGRTALMLTSTENWLDIASILFEAKANMNLQDQDGWTALMYAIQSSSFEMVRHLLEHGADPEIVNHQKKTAMVLAKYKEEDDVVNLLEAFLSQKNLNQALQSAEDSSSYSSRKIPSSVPTRL